MAEDPDAAASKPACPAAQLPESITYTSRLQPQPDLEIVGVGASGQVYKVDDHIVLKTCRIFEPPSNDSSSRYRWFYASDTLFHFNLLQDERTVLRLLAQRPHPNIVEVIDTDYPEGLYLRKYLPLPDVEVPMQPGRILWYRDITRALFHLHDLGITHSDLRIENILFSPEGRAFLCDFSASCPFGQPNPAYPHPDLPVPINGLSEIVSDATDRFAMGSLIFQMEHGSRPNLSIDYNGILIIPEVQTGHNGVDEVIREAWLGKYSSTAQMLKHIESLCTSSRDIHSPRTYSVSRESLRDRIRQWREHREKSFGSVLSAIPNEDQLRDLADHYGWDKDGGRRFCEYEVL